MKKKFKVWTAAFMAATVLGAGSITASAAPAVTPPASSEEYIFAGYEEKLASGASEIELAKARLVRQTFYSSKGVKGMSREYSYDNLGRLSEMRTIYSGDTTPAYRTVYAYDGQGNITKWVEYLDGKVWAQADYSFVYDKEGKPLEYTSKELKGPSGTLKFSYDSQGRLIGKVGYTGGKLDLNIGYRYDAEGRLIEIAQIAVAEEVLNFPEAEYSLRWTFAYDAGGRLIKINDADCVYDELGNLVREVRKDGSRIEYVYG